MVTIGFYLMLIPIAVAFGRILWYMWQDFKARKYSELAGPVLALMMLIGVVLWVWGMQNAGQLQ